MKNKPSPKENSNINEEEKKSELKKEIKKKKHFKFFWINIVIGVLMVVILLLVLAYLAPGRQDVKPFPPSEEPRLIFEEKNKGTELTTYENETIYLSKSFIKDNIDPYIHYDEDKGYITITTSDTVFQLQKDKTTLMVNDEEAESNYPPIKHKETPFLPVDLLEKIYSITIDHNSKDNLVIVEDFTNPVLKGYIKDNETGILREGPSIRKGIIDRLEENDKVYIYEEKDNWFFVRSPKGYLGYISGSDISLGDINFRKTKTDISPSSLEVTMGEGINLTWEHVINNTPNPDNMPSLPGVNIISPTWFHLENSKGDIHDAAEKSFVNWAHNEGMEVWALFSNRFEPEMTHQFLRDPLARRKAINQLLTLAETYNLDGINLDFENMYYEDKDYYTQFVRELTPRLRKNDLIVSVDVTFISESENWSKVYDRKALAETVDFVMVMAYDEHYRESDIAGSVASLPWVRENLMEILEVVPNQQLVLGIPFYTRLWEKKEDETGEIKVSSSAHGMEEINNILEEQNANKEFDPDTEQYYASYTSGDKKYKTWLETEKSLKKRLELVEKYDLAGIASWRRGFEKEEIWDLINKELDGPSIFN